LKLSSVETDVTDGVIFVEISEFLAAFEA